MTAHGREWWRDAVVYQVYIRSFADGDGDGVGDISGIRSRLSYLEALGVDAIWITPWYPSPLVDGGYDVADYRDIHPSFGTLADAKALLDEAHGLGLRVIADIVPNHTSDRHAWFVEALAAEPGSPARSRYLFRDGLAGGSAPPNDWRSAFGGPAWTRVTEPDGSPGQWYLHLFAPEQPDLDWTNPEVHAEFESILRFWFDLGVDGFRIDVANALAKSPTLPDLGYSDAENGGATLRPWDRDDHPHWDVEAVHDIYRDWRKIGDGYDGRMFVAEAIVGTPDRLAPYVRRDTLHTAFNFPFMHAPWEAATLRSVIDDTLGALGAVEAPATWLLSSHDETRHLTRYGRADTRVQGLAQERVQPVDLELGERRARAALLLMLALPGGACLYQGEELGLPQVENLPDDALQDPAWTRSGGAVRGRDGCRVPIPWSGREPPFGFGPPGSTPWLPQPADWKAFTAEAEADDLGSMLALYRGALRTRRDQPGFAGDGFRWLDPPGEVLCFERGAGLRCAVNFAAEPFALPEEGRVLLASTPLAGRGLEQDTAAWFTAGP